MSVCNGAPGPNAFTDPASNIAFDVPPGWTVSQQGSGQFHATLDQGEFIFTTQQGSANLGAAMDQAVKSLPTASYSQVTLLGDIHGAQIGYAQGQGKLYSAQFIPGNGGTAFEDRIAVLASTHGNTTVVVVATSSFSTDRGFAPSGMTGSGDFDYVLANLCWSS